MLLWTPRWLRRERLRQGTSNLVGTITVGQQMCLGLRRMRTLFSRSKRTVMHERTKEEPCKLLCRISLMITLHPYAYVAECILPAVLMTMVNLPRA